MTIEVVTDRDADFPQWSLHVGAETTVMELAALLGGIGFRASVHFAEKGPIGARGVIVRPMDPGTPIPTAAQIRDVLQHGLAKLPTLRIVWRIEPA